MKIKEKNKINYEKVSKMLRLDDMEKYLEKEATSFHALKVKDRFKFVEEVHLNYLKENMINSKDNEIMEFLKSLNQLLKEDNERILSEFKEWKIEKIKNNQEIINDLEKILNQNELREYCREKEINILDLNVVTGKTEFQLLFDNNLKYVKENINLSYGKEEILNLYKNKGLRKDIENKIKSLNLNLSESFKNGIIKNITKAEAEKQKFVLNEFGIINLNIEYQKAKGLFEYIQRLEKRKNSLDKEKDILEIRMIENTISKFEVKNYINYLEKEYELRIAESKYKKYYNIPNIEEPTKPQPKQEKKSKKRDYWER